MMLEEKTMLTVEFSQGNTDFFGLWPQDYSSSYPYLRSIVKPDCTYLELFLITALTRYADFLSHDDMSGFIRNQLDTIYSEQSSLNTKIHQLFALDFNTVASVPFDLSECSEHIANPELDIAEIEARRMSEQLDGRSYYYRFYPLRDLTEIDKITTAPADTIAIGILINFAIDLARREASAQQEDTIDGQARRILRPITTITPSDTARSKIIQLTEFVAQGIAQL